MLGRMLHSSVAVPATWTASDTGTAAARGTPTASRAPTLSCVATHPTSVAASRAASGASAFTANTATSTSSPAAIAIASSAKSRAALDATTESAPAPAGTIPAPVDTTRHASSRAVRAEPRQHDWRSARRRRLCGRRRLRPSAASLVSGQQW